MPSRQTLPEIQGGDHILADAIGAPLGLSQKPEPAHHRQSGLHQARVPQERNNHRSRADFAASSPIKKKVPFNLPADLAEEVRDAVFALSGPPYCLSLALFAENALRTELARLKQAENSGQQFPRRSGRIQPGRRVE